MIGGEKISENLTISFSKAKVFRRCRQEFTYKYVENLEKIAPALPLIRGKILHEMIEAWLKGASWEDVLARYETEYKKLFVEESELYGDLPGELRRIMTGYIKRYQNDSFTYPAVELEFSVPLIEGVDFHGRIDAIAQDVDGGLWVMETKTHKKLPEDDVRLLNLQTVLYTWVVPQLEEFKDAKVKGVLWNYVRTKAPAIPELLKNGTFSMRKNIDTDFDTYLETIKSAGHDPDQYSSILSILENKQDQFFKRINFPHPSPTLQMTLLADFAYTAEEMVAFLNGDLGCFRNISPFLCKNCAYKSLCEAELFDLDKEFILKTQYQVRAKEEEDDKNVN